MQIFWSVTAIASLLAIIVILTRESHDWRYWSSMLGFRHAACAAHLVPRGEPILLQHNSSAITLEAEGSPGPDELVQGAGAPRGRSGGGAGGVLGVSAGDVRVRERPR